MKNASIARPFSLRALVLLHWMLGFSALIGGGMMIGVPDGSLLGMEARWLDSSPFDSYLVPGFLLFALVGVLPLVTSFGLLTQHRSALAEKCNLYVGQHWSWAFSIYAGIVTTCWIVAQLLLTRYFWLQSVILVVALLIQILTLLPSTIRYLKQQSVAEFFIVS